MRPGHVALVMKVEDKYKCIVVCLRLLDLGKMGYWVLRLHEKKGEV